MTQVKSQDDLRSRASLFFRELQDTICREIQALNGETYQEDSWSREGGGGGRTRVFSGGSFLEKGGVNFSEVHGKLQESHAAQMPVGKGLDFFAAGVSLVLHPKNPFVPTVHANYRYLERGGEGWFGGGADLTPYYPFEEDAVHFHRVHSAALSDFGTDLYPRFKKQCDDYFYLPHRGETRGIGGIFFDYLREPNLERAFEIVQACGKSFLFSYVPIVNRRKDIAFTEAEKEFQEIRRGRYVEFNLLYDRGTVFGLKTNGRVESILMSLPLKARWVYDYKPAPGSRESRLQEFLKPRDWVY